MTEFEESDSGLEPRLLVAETVNLYETPGVRPEMVAGLAEGETCSVATLMVV
jgi:hypothetical protein